MVWGEGLKGSGFRVWGSGFRFRIDGVLCRVSDSGLGVQAVGVSGVVGLSWVLFRVPGEGVLNPNPAP